jgi:hypothetical protein
MEWMDVTVTWVDTIVTKFKSLTFQIYYSPVKLSWTLQVLTYE